MNNTHHLFRFWDKEDKKYIYYKSLSNIQIPYTEKSTFPQYESSTRFHDGVFEQCSGKSAQRSYREDLLLFEGDRVILRTSWCGKHELGTVKYGKCQFYIRPDNCTTEDHYYWLGSFTITDIEIIGTIHETK